MHDQPIPAESDDALARAVLDLLTIDHCGHWSLAELDRTLAGSAAPSASRTADVVESLYAAGLLHRSGEFVFATRAAHEAQRLAG
jgi:HD-like signal output (HDOD) protein